MFLHGVASEDNEDFGIEESSPVQQPQEVISRDKI
jgi:hypothetical protein